MVSMISVFRRLGLGLLGVVSAVGASRAQRPGAVLDSLHQVIRRHPADSAGARAYVALSEQVLNSNQDSAVYFARRAIRVGQRTGLPLLASAYMRLGTARYYKGQFVEAGQAYDSALVWARRYGDSRQMGEAMRRQGNVHMEAAQYPEAIASYRQAMLIHSRAKQSVESAMALGNIGFVHKMSGNYDQALVCFFQSLRQLEQALDTETRTPAAEKKALNAKGSVLSYIGETYNRTKNWAQARVYLSRLQTHYQQTGNIEGVANTLTNLANTNASSGNLALAETQLTQSLAIQRQRHDVLAVAIAQSNLAEILERRQKHRAALALFESALVMYRQTHNLRQPYHSYVGSVTARLGLGQLPQARMALDSARRYIRQMQSKQAYATYYEAEQAYFEQAGQPAMALRSYRLYTQYKDSLLDADKSKVLADLTVRYETDKKEAQNQLLQKQQQLQAALFHTQGQVLRRRNTQLLAALLVAGLLGVVGYLLFNRRRLRQQVELEQQQQRLERQRVAAVLEAEENERRRIGSDLHDGIGQLLTAAKLNLHALGHQLGDRLDGHRELLDNAMEVVDESFREVRGISHNLMPNALLKRGLAAAVRDFLNKLPSNQGLRVEVEAFGLDDVRLDPTVESVLFRVIQELVQNIIKHANASQISLQLVRNEDELTVMVEDNGIGFDPAALGPDAGIGLRNVATRLAYLGGQAQFDSMPGRGTTVTLEVPLRALA